MDLVEKVDFESGSGLVPAVVQAEDGRVLMLAYMDRRALRRTLEVGRVTFWSRSREELWEKGATSGHWLEALEVATDCDRDAVLVRARPHGPACHTGEATCFEAGDRAAVDADPGPPDAAGGSPGGGGPGGSGDDGEDAGDRESPGAAGSGGAARPVGGGAPGRAAAGPRHAPPGPPEADHDLSEAGPSPAPVLASVLEELVAVVERRDRERPEGSYTASLLADGPAHAARKLGEEALEVVLATLQEPGRLAEESADLLYHLVVLWRAAGLPADAVGRELSRRRGAPAADGGSAPGRSRDRGGSGGPSETRGEEPGGPEKGA